MEVYVGDMMVNSSSLNLYTDDLVEIFIVLKKHNTRVTLRNAPSGFDEVNFSVLC